MIPNIVNRIFLASIVVLALFVPRITRAESEPVVAVLYFDNNSGDQEFDVFSKGFADMLITDLSSSEQVTVVEREKLQALLDESKLQRSRFFDKKTAVKIGKGLGAGYVVSGSFTSMKPQLRIDVRMIDVASGKVVLGTKVKGLSSSVFELEQQLVADFLRKLDLKFFPDALPPTKVPNVESLLNYSKGLALIDKGENQQAAAILQSTVKMAPAFALARLRHGAILKKLAASKVQRTEIVDRSSKALFARARSFIATHSLASATEEEARAHLAYRALLGAEIRAALHEALPGRTSRAKLVPRKGGARGLQLMRALYENQRLLINEQKSVLLRFPYARASLRGEEDNLVRELKLDYNDSNPKERLLDFVLEGRVRGGGQVESFNVSPSLSDLDAKIRKASLALAEAMTKPKKGSLKLHEKLEIVRIHELLAEYQIARGKVELGIAEYQKILDRFPKLPRWDFYEKRIKQELGLEHNHSVGQRKRYEKGLAACDAWDVHVGHRSVLSARIRYMGLKALPATLKEVEKACKSSPELEKMKKRLYQSFFLEAARFEDCEWFDLYVKKWLALGGSTQDAAGYRKNYSDCR